MLITDFLFFRVLLVSNVHAYYISDAYQILGPISARFSNSGKSVSFY